jgi:hypothetical protein
VLVRLFGILCSIRIVPVGNSYFTINNQNKHFKDKKKRSSELLLATNDLGGQ